MFSELSNEEICNEKQCAYSCRLLYKFTPSLWELKVSRYLLLLVGHKNWGGTQCIIYKIEFLLTVVIVSFLSTPYRWQIVDVNLRKLCKFKRSEARQSDQLWTLSWRISGLLSHKRMRKNLKWIWSSRAGVGEIINYLILKNSYVIIRQAFLINTYACCHHPLHDIFVLLKWVLI